MFSFSKANPLVLIGCGNMGGALLEGWLKAGVQPSAICVVSRRERPDLVARGVHVGSAPPPGAAAYVVAVKPAVVEDSARLISDHVQGALVVSVVAGVTLNMLRAAFPDARIVRAMPNTPASIGLGMTALIAGPDVDDDELRLASLLMRAVGKVIVLEKESQMDAATAVSGSGPGFVFHMIEAMAEAGQAQGLGAQAALELARQTVAGAGMLAITSEDLPSKIRADVTSPNGTTAAGLKVLMEGETSLTTLMTRTIAAAAARSREISDA